jgi:hypothetical protein
MGSDVFITQRLFEAIIFVENPQAHGLLPVSLVYTHAWEVLAFLIAICSSQVIGVENERHALGVEDTAKGFSGFATSFNVIDFGNAAPCGISESPLL